MDEQLTGLGIFVRPVSAEVDHATAVAVNLNLRPSAPRADRPWACRVSATLMKPSADGLARNVADIERLATLGQAMVTRLASEAVFAAAVTAKGARTWLLYAAGPDVAAVTAGVKSAVRMAFAEQADYVPSVVVCADPAWVGYLALCPTPVEARDIHARRAESAATAAARDATHAAVQSLRASGVDLSRPAPVRYAVQLPTVTAAEELAVRAAAFGLRPEPAVADAPARLRRDDLPDLALILRTERWLIREATRLGGRYEGWSPAQAA